MAQAGTLTAEPAEAPPKRRRAPKATTNGAGNGAGKIKPSKADPVEAAAPNGTASNGTGLTSTGRQRKPMGQEHKHALAQGRNAGRAVRNYLEALAATSPRRGRPKSRERMETRLAEIEERLDHVDPLARLHMTQEMLDLRAEMAHTVEPVDISGLETEFIEWAAQYSRSKGLTYEAWRLAGVPRHVLTQAGIGR